MMNDQLDQFITMPHDATSTQLELLFASRADILAGPHFTFSKQDQAYTWSMTFVDYAGPVPLLQRVGGRQIPTAAASVSYTRSRGSGARTAV